MVLPFPILLTSYLYLKNVVILHQKRHLYLNSAIPDTKLYKTILNVMLKIVMSTSVPLSNTGFQFMLKIISVLTLQKTKHSSYADNKRHTPKIFLKSMSIIKVQML